MLKASLYCLGVGLYNEKQGKRLWFYRNQTQSFPLSFGMKWPSCRSRGCAPLREGWGGALWCEKESWSRNGCRNQCGDGRSFQRQEKALSEDRLFRSLQSSFRLSGWLPPPGWCELEEESFVNEARNKATHSVRWLGLNFQISDFMKSDSKINLVFAEQHQNCWLRSKKPNWCG